MAFGKKNKDIPIENNARDDDDQLLDLVFDMDSGEMSFKGEEGTNIDTAKTEEAAGTDAVEIPAEETVPEENSAVEAEGGEGEDVTGGTETTETEEPPEATEAETEATEAEPETREAEAEASEAKPEEPEADVTEADTETSEVEAAAETDETAGAEDEEKPEAEDAGAATGAEGNETVTADQDIDHEQESAGAEEAGTEERARDVKYVIETADDLGAEDGDFKAYGYAWAKRAGNLFAEEESVTENEVPFAWVGVANTPAEGASEEEKPEEKTEETPRPQNREKGRADKVKAEKLDDLINEKSTKGADYATDKLRGILGISKSGETEYDKIAGMKLSTWVIIVLTVFFVDTILVNFVAYKAIYPLVQAVMKAIGVEALKKGAAYTETLNTIISYAISFVFCGLLVLILCKFTEMLLEQLGRKNSNTLITKTLLVMMLIFMVIGLLAMIIAQKGPLTLTAYRWFCPFLGYAGGLVFFLLSQIGKNSKK